MALGLPASMRERPPHVAKLGEITGKTRVLYSELGKITGKTRVLPGGSLSGAFHLRQYIHKANKVYRLCNPKLATTVHGSVYERLWEGRNGESEGKNGNKEEEGEGEVGPPLAGLWASQTPWYPS